jgi:nitrogen fixation protein NifU and related proteins
MGDKFYDFSKKLQNQIFEETKAAYGDVAFERWCKPLFMSSMENPDGYGCIKGSCGDTMQIYLKFKNDRVKESSFQTDGCGSSVICGSFAAELALEKDPDELINITGETILNLLGRWPEDERHCAFLAAETLQEALDDYMKRRAQPTR